MITTKQTRPHKCTSPKGRGMFLLCLPLSPGVPPHHSPTWSADLRLKRWRYDQVFTCYLQNTFKCALLYFKRFPKLNDKLYGLLNLRGINHYHGRNHISKGTYYLFPGLLYKMSNLKYLPLLLAATPHLFNKYYSVPTMCLDCSWPWVYNNKTNKSTTFMKPTF